VHVVVLITCGRFFPKKKYGSGYAQGHLPMPNPGIMADSLILPAHSGRTVAVKGTNDNKNLNKEMK
jgi:hypothetical protein